MLNEWVGQVADGAVRMLTQGIKAASYTCELCLVMPPPMQGCASDLRTKRYGEAGHGQHQPRDMQQVSQTGPGDA